MGTQRPGPDAAYPGRHRGDSAPSTTGGRALALCRERLHAAVQLLVEANSALRGTVEARDRALVELLEAERAQDAFVIAAVHELKTPLTAVKGRAQLLRIRSQRPGGLSVEDVWAGLLEIESAADKLTADLDALVDEVGRPLPGLAPDGERTPMGR